MPELTKNRKQRIKKAINYLNQHSNDAGTRKKLLTNFAEENNTSYNTVKKDLRALSYASLTGPDGFDLRYVPKTYKEDVKKLWNEFNGNPEQGFEQGGEIDITDAMNASRIFLKHHPKEDLERIRETWEKPVIKEELQQKIQESLKKDEKTRTLQEHKKLIKEVKNSIKESSPKTLDKHLEKKDTHDIAEKIDSSELNEINRLQEKVTENLLEAAEQKASIAHPARIYSQVWAGKIGQKIHRELKQAIKKAPEGKKTQAIHNIWRKNVLESVAARLYQEFENDYLRQLDQLGIKQEEYQQKKGQKMPTWLNKWVAKREGKELEELEQKDVMKRLANDYKALRRYNKPGKRPRNVKELRQSIKEDIPEIYDELSETEKQEDFMQTLREHSQKLRAADQMYSESREMETK